MRAGEIALAILAAATLTACGKSYSYNYRVTVTVRDHGKLKQAVNIVSVKESVSDGRRLTAESCGEATAMALQDGTVLVALMSGPPPHGQFPHYQWLGVPTGVILERLGLPTEFASGQDSGLLRLKENQPPIELLPYEYPELVIFKRSNDPTSIQRIDRDSTDTAFGPNVELKSISLAPTREEVTRGKIASFLPWLHPKDEYLDGSGHGLSVQRVQSASFKHC
jgi:hypothetical protein